MSSPVCDESQLLESYPDRLNLTHKYVCSLRLGGGSSTATLHTASSISTCMSLHRAFRPLLAITSTAMAARMKLF